MIVASAIAYKISPHTYIIKNSVLQANFQITIAYLTLRLDNQWATELYKQKWGLTAQVVKYKEGCIKF